MEYVQLVCRPYVIIALASELPLFRACGKGRVFRHSSARSPPEV